MCGRAGAGRPKVHLCRDGRFGRAAHPYAGVLRGVDPFEVKEHGPASHTAADYSRLTTQNLALRTPPPGFPTRDADSPGRKGKTPTAPNQKNLQGKNRVVSVGWCNLLPMPLDFYRLLTSSPNGARSSYLLRHVVYIMPPAPGVRSSTSSQPRGFSSVSPS